MGGHRTCSKCGLDGFKHETIDAHEAACDGDVEALQERVSKLDSTVAYLLTVLEGRITALENEVQTLKKQRGGCEP